MHSYVAFCMMMYIKNFVYAILRIITINAKIRMMEISKYKSSALCYWTTLV